jgi:hypothetical protein
VLRAAEETETTQENMQDWPELDEGDLLFIFISTTYVVLFFIWSFRAIFYFINLDCSLL